MEIKILHDELSADSRAFMVEFNAMPLAGVEVISDHGAAVAACPNFSAYPAVLVKEGNELRVLSPATSWADALNWINSPPEPAPAPRIISQFAFSRLFTKAERIAIRQAAKVNADVEDFLDILDRAGEVDLDLQDTVDGVTAMEGAGLIGVGRAVQILAGVHP